MKNIVLSILILITMAFSAKSQLSGNYTIGGTGANYSTITSAISALTSAGVSGQVTFNITPGNYPEQISIGNISGASATNRITFQSSNGDSTSVVISLASNTVSTNNYLLKTSNSHFITFKSLTLKRTGTNVYSTVVEMTGSSTQISFLNCIFKTDIINDASYDNCLIKSENLNANGTEFLLLSKNRFINSSCGILLQGISSAATELSDSIKLIGNSFENQYREAISLNYCNAPIVSGNSIASTSTYSTFKAMNLFYCLGGVRVANNSINIQKNYGIYFQNSIGNGAFTGLISNNIIVVAGAGSYGIWYGSSGNHNIYFNSILASGSTSTCIYFSGSTTLDINLENNIFANTGGGQSIVLATGVSSPFALIDFNDYYTTGSVLGTWKTISCANLSAIKTASGMDISSVSLIPNFISTSNLHLSNTSTLSRKGTLALSSPISTTDYDGQNRHTSKPDIGADEYSFDNIKTNNIIVDTLICQGLVLPIKVKIKNVGNASIIGNLGISYQINNQNPITEYQNQTNFIVSDSITYTFTAPYTFSTLGNSIIKVWTTWSNDINKSNDTTSISVNVTQKPTVYLGADTNLCAERHIVLDAGVGFNTYLWNTNATSQTINVDSSGIGLSGRFFRVTVTKNGCAAKDSILVRFVDCSGIETDNSKNFISIYPNPVEKVLNFSNLDESIQSIEMRNMTGILVKRENIESSQSEIEISELASGLYIIRFISENKIISKKFIKK